jgi:hypothetical protein
MGRGLPACLPAWQGLLARPNPAEAFPLGLATVEHLARVMSVPSVLPPPQPPPSIGRAVDDDDARHQGQQQQQQPRPATVALSGGSSVAMDLVDSAADDGGGGDGLEQTSSEQASASVSGGGGSSSSKHRRSPQLPICLVLDALLASELTPGGALRMMIWDARMMISMVDTRIYIHTYMYMCGPAKRPAQRYMCRMCVPHVCV